MVLRDKTNKNDLTMHQPMDDNDEALEFIVGGRRWSKPREDISFAGLQSLYHWDYIERWNSKRKEDKSQETLK